MEADRRAQRMVGTVHGLIVAAGVLAVSAADVSPDVVEVGVYVLATVAAFWLADAWGHGLALRAAGGEEHGLRIGLRRQLPVLEAVIPPLAALAVATLAGATDENAITAAVWVCVGALGLLGAGVARREGLPAHRVAMTSAGCAGAGLVMVALKAFVH